MTTEGNNKDEFSAAMLVGANLYFSIGESEVKLVLSKTNDSGDVFFQSNINTQGNLTTTFPIELGGISACKKVVVGIKTSKFVVVPASFFDTKASKEYLQQIFEIDWDLKVHYKLLRPMNAFIVYQHSKSITDNLNLLPKVDQVIPEIDCFVQYISIQRQKADLYLHFDNRSFYMYVIKADKILDILYYDFMEATDAIYFILSVLSRYDIDPVTSKTVLSGSIMPYSELYNIIYRFIGEVEWFSPAESSKVLKTTKQQNPHTFAELYCLSQCV